MKNEILLHANFAVSQQQSKHLKPVVENAEPPGEGCTRIIAQQGVQSALMRAKENILKTHIFHFILFSLYRVKLKLK